MHLKMACAILFVTAMPAAATCVGGSSFQSCYDAQSGNNYTVQRYGNTTQVYGNNARTGSSWSQQSTDLGGTTFNSGTDKNGRSWSSTCTGDFCN